VRELELTVCAASTQNRQLDRCNKELRKQQAALQQQLDYVEERNEDLTQQKAHVEERPGVAHLDGAAMRREIQELHHKVQVLDQQLLQVSSGAEAPDSNRAKGEPAELQTQVGTLTELLQKLETEKDKNNTLRRESLLWEGKLQKVLEELNIHKEHSRRQVSQLESELAELRSQLLEPPPPQPPAGPSEEEGRLQEEARRLQRQLERVEEHLQAQMHDNETLRLLNQEQEERLLPLQLRADIWSQQAEDHKKILETVENDRTTASRALQQNRQLKEQLAELQDAFITRTNENAELTCALQSAQHLNTQLSTQVGQLQSCFLRVTQEKQEFGSTFSRYNSAMATCPEPWKPWHRPLPCSNTRR
jgi:chromosome segregation ATPase